jgi:hypothetical protein
MDHGALRRRAPLLRQGNNRQQAGSSSPICKAMAAGEGCVCQVFNPLMPDLTAGDRENRLEVRPDLSGSEGLTHLLSSLAARTDY